MYPPAPDAQPCELSVHATEYKVTLAIERAAHDWSSNVCPKKPPDPTTDFHWTGGGGGGGGFVVEVGVGVGVVVVPESSPVATVPASSDDGVGVVLGGAAASSTAVCGVEGDELEHAAVRTGARHVT
jgi:hypothetical protein